MPDPVLGVFSKGVIAKCPIYHYKATNGQSFRSGLRGTYFLM